MSQERKNTYTPTPEKPNEQPSASVSETAAKPKRVRIRRNIPTFLAKLFKICTSNEHQTLIRWADDGASFEIVNKEQFEAFILPTFFKHNNINSFVRQLNMYDFHKRNRSAQECIFQHPYFVRGRPDLLNQIKRKTNS